MIKIGSALVEYAEQLERERGIAKELVLDSLKDAMIAAYRKFAKLPDNDGLSCKLIERTGEIGLFEHKLVVEEVIDPDEGKEFDEDGNLIEPEALDEEAEGSEDSEEEAVEEIVEEVVLVDEDGNPVEAGEDEEIVEEVVLVDEDGNPVEAGEDEEIVEEVVLVDEDGNPIEGDSEEYEVVEEVMLVDEDGNPIEAAEGDEYEYVEEEEDEEEKPLAARHQITLQDARRIKPDIQLGQELQIEVTPDNFDRFAAQMAKQVIMQRIREAEKENILKEFEERKHSVTTAVVSRVEGRNVIVSIGRFEAYLPPREQLRGEFYRIGNKLRVFVSDLKDSGRVPQIIVSQAHPAMVREVFELEVPEIEDGLVEIKAIAREAGSRTKVAVHSPDPNMDPQGACIGSRGSRIQSIVNELKNEKIDIIRWSPEPLEFIMNALAPARIMDVRLDTQAATPRALVVVPDDQLSLAIGREGQNVRLAAKLTGFKLDIKSAAQFEQIRQEFIARQQALAAEEDYQDEDMVDPANDQHEANVEEEATVLSNEQAAGHEPQEITAETSAGQAGEPLEEGVEEAEAPENVETAEEAEPVS